MLRALKFLCAVFLLALVASNTARGAALKAGVAKVDITPPTGVAMWGYFDRTTPAKGTIDPLYARVLVLERGAAEFEPACGRPAGAGRQEARTPHYTAVREKGESPAIEFASRTWDTRRVLWQHWIGHNARRWKAFPAR